jgi:histidinol-phosphate/aromatic aminotransferase/cobyric acid decarboxylase-like protein
MVRFEADAFERAGILVREGAALGYRGWSRVTVGNSEENERVILAVESPYRAVEQGAEQNAERGA